jgi:hypothetical protein
VKLYDVPFFRPDTLQVSFVVVHFFADGNDVTTYLVIRDPPVLEGFAHDTVAAALEALACTDLGADGLTEEPTAGAANNNPTVKASPPTREVRNEGRIRVSFVTSGYQVLTAITRVTLGKVFISILGGRPSRH